MSPPTLTSPRSATSPSASPSPSSGRPSPGRVWHGHIAIAPTTVITYGTRNVGECIINVDDANGELLPNTNVTVTVTTARKPHVLTIPREAVHTDPNQQSYVFRVVKGKLVRTPVVVGIYNQNSEEIICGLSEGETIVLTPATASQRPHRRHGRHHRP